MVKIKILKSFPTTHYGFLAKNSEAEVAEGFAKYAVETMKAAEYIKAPKKPTKIQINKK
jgi:hypothetical protein